MMMRIIIMAEGERQGLEPYGAKQQGPALRGRHGGHGGPQEGEGDDAGA